MGHGFRIALVGNAPFVDERPVVLFPNRGKTGATTDAVHVEAIHAVGDVAASGHGLMTPHDVAAFQAELPAEEQPHGGPALEIAQAEQRR